MRYELSDGIVINAQDAADMVHQMHESSYSQCDTDAKFMAETAKRVKLATGKEISSSDADSFVEGLVDAGLVKIKPEKGGAK